MAPEKCIVDPSRDCLGLAKAEMLEKQIAEYRQQSRETHSELLHQDHSSGKIRRKTGRAVQQDPGQAQRHAGGY